MSMKVATNWPSLIARYASAGCVSLFFVNVGFAVGQPVSGVVAGVALLIVVDGIK